jgi:glycosyltransferase involved in cell wall biosynthesis
MACKTPVIASDVGGLTTIIQNNVNGLLSQPRNPVDLKEKILQIYTNKDSADLMAKNAKKMVIDNYSWKNIAGKISNIYNGLIINNNHSQNENPLN